MFYLAAAIIRAPTHCEIVFIRVSAGCIGPPLCCRAYYDCRISTRPVIEKMAVEVSEKLNCLQLLSYETDLNDFFLQIIILFTVLFKIKNNTENLCYHRNFIHIRHFNLQKLRKYISKIAYVGINCTLKIDK